MWFRQDLRLSDNPALLAAAASGAPVICVYVLDDVSPGVWKRGGASRWWLHHSLASLDKDLRAFGAGLTLLRGDARTVIPDLVKASGAHAVYWNRRYEAWARTRDEAIKTSLKQAGVEARSFNGSLIVEPWDIATKKGAPYRVFTPFWKALQASHAPPEPAGRPSKLQVIEGPGGEDLASWGLLPTKPDWAGGLRDAWTPGEASAQGRLGEFIANRVKAYAGTRNLPAEHGTSRLSPHLHFGEISPRQVWHGVEQAGLTGSEGGRTYLSEIGWREFSYNLLYHFPDLPDANFQPRFDRFDWTGTPDQLEAWKRGQTGYPIVDAGMRELWHTGWMHNRVRMITASFLIKDLFIDWREGEAWFWDTLVDADLASNAASWQWTAGSGADAAPYFRIFNPVSQGEKFDPDGAYVRKWIPELAGLDADVIHAPWTAGGLALARAGVKLGTDYPEPMVDHAGARKAALAAFEKIKDIA
ncbi:cryptochrome/photolyase family protein [Alkalicaulis satelles]|nr:deoxyribodipyrimidine photo-lyase [Alkalicaulis satelles]